MIGIIPRPIHALLDYLWSIAHFFAPELFGFAGDDAASAFCKFRGGSAIGSSLFTRYELGLIKVLPFNMHLFFDFIGAAGSLFAPKLLGFEKNKKASQTVLLFAAIEIVAVLLSRRDKK